MMDLGKKPRPNNWSAKLRPMVALLALYACAQSPQPSAVPGQPHPYLAVNAKEPAVYPEAASRGSFVVANGCVSFRRVGDGFMLTPIFPKGSRLVPNGRGSFDLIVSNSQIPLGKEVRIGGGEVVLPNYAEAVLQSAAPATCPSKYWIIGGIDSL